MNEEWKKLGTKGEYDYFIHEKKMPEEKPIISLTSIRSIIRSIEVPSKVLDIIAVKGNELVGFLEASILEDKITSTMVMQTQLSKIELPEKVSDSKLNIHRHNGAIFVDEEHRKQGIAKTMMTELFKALKEHHIKSLKIHDIKEEAIELYRVTGAEFNDEKGASYNIEEMSLPNEEINPNNSVEI